MLTEPNVLSAYLYLLMEEQMPEPICLEDGTLDVEADNAQLEEWSHRVNSVRFDMRAITAFIFETQCLLFDLETLQLDPNEPAGPQYMTLFYDAAKRTFNNDKTQIRTYFLWLYYVIFQRPEGPRWGDFVEIYGVEEFAALTHRRFEELI